jgi:hypothetical protein
MLANPWAGPDAAALALLRQHRVIDGGVGHNLPRKPPAFTQAIIDASHL